MFNFKDPKSIILVLNILHLRISSAQCSNPLIFKETTDGSLCGYRKIGKFAGYIMWDLQKVSTLFILQLYFTDDYKNKIHLFFYIITLLFNTFFPASYQLLNNIITESLLLHM
jgi:hypothetical protein